MFRDSTTLTGVYMSGCDIYEKRKIRGMEGLAGRGIWTTLNRAELTRRTTENRAVARNRPLSAKRQSGVYGSVRKR